MVIDKTFFVSLYIEAKKVCFIIFPQKPKLIERNFITIYSIVMDFSDKEPLKVACVLSDFLNNIFKSILRVFIILYTIDNRILICVFSI